MSLTCRFTNGNKAWTLLVAWGKVHGCSCEKKLNLIREFYKLCKLYKGIGLDITLHVKHISELRDILCLGGMEDWDGSLGLPGWLGRLVKYEDGMYLRTVTHQSTNRAWRRITSLFETNAYVTKPKRHFAIYSWPIRELQFPCFNLNKI